MTDPENLTNILISLLDELRTGGNEKEWIECKVSYAYPYDIGEYISALANSSTLNNKENGWMIWGVEDGTWLTVGTRFSPSKLKVKAKSTPPQYATGEEQGEELNNWLLRQLTPGIDIRFYEFLYLGKQVVLLDIPAAAHTPVSFHDQEFIRVGSYKKRLKEYPEKERALWQIFSRTSFEGLIAASGMSDDQVLGVLRYESYFELLDLPIPSERTRILHRLEEDRLIKAETSQSWAITNLGAILFARKLSGFSSLKRKSLRVILYEGVRRTGSKKEHLFDEGYASSFEEVIRYIKDLTQTGELIEDGFNKKIYTYPDITIRELIPNALIHQDFQITGTGPMVEIFEDRMEITNPGSPLMDTLRFIDIPPKSRNEDLAAFMRRIEICEERGSGIDKVIESVEHLVLPPPDFKNYDSSTKAILYAQKDFSDMNWDERVRACYQHSCLCSVSNQVMTNSSLRVRFGLNETESSTVSRIIQETLKRDLIKPADPDSHSKRHAKYIPFWQ